MQLYGRPFYGGQAARPPVANFGQKRAVIGRVAPKLTPVRINNVVCPRFLEEATEYPRIVQRELEVRTENPAPRPSGKNCTILGTMITERD